MQRAVPQLYLERCWKWRQTSIIFYNYYYMYFITVNWDFLDVVIFWFIWHLVWKHEN